MATLGWNHARHLEAYFAIPLAGGVLHTLNPRLSGQDLAYIMNHAEDRFLLVDDVLLPVYERFHKDVNLRAVVVWTHGHAAPDFALDYEQMIEPEMNTFAFPNLEEGQAAGLCYTSGTTGRPKGVVYSHRALVLHSMVSALPDALGLSFGDAMLPVVPMFHVNAWGLPFTATMVGREAGLPRARTSTPRACSSCSSSEKVTLTAGVPTVWLGILDELDRNPGRLGHLLDQGHDRRGRGRAEGDDRGVREAARAPRHPRLGHDRDHAARDRGPAEAPPREGLRRGAAAHARPRRGSRFPSSRPGSSGRTALVPPDGKSMGELQVRGPWVAKSYFQNPAEADKFTMDGWFRTGDIVTVDGEGYVRITDRSKDLIKSGGEWISSVDLENALMGHPAVKEAAVVAVAHPRWGERPVAAVVLKEGAKATPHELTEYLTPLFARYWLPDAFVYMDAIPRNATGKFLKSALREQLKDHRWEEPRPGRR